MVLTRGRCACRAGERWNGRHCRRITSTSSGTSTPRCTGNRPVGTYPTAAPSGPPSAMAPAAREAVVPRRRGAQATVRWAPSPTAAPPGRFSATAHAAKVAVVPRRRGARATVQWAPSPTAVPPGRSSATAHAGREAEVPTECTGWFLLGDRPVGTFPNCCPTGTFFSNGVPAGSGGSNGVQQGGSCLGDRPVGTFPNCCPRGMTFDRGACRRSVARGHQRNAGLPRQSSDRHAAQLLPTGTFFSNGKCRTGSGGSNGVQQGGSCGGDRPVRTSQLLSTWHDVRQRRLPPAASGADPGARQADAATDADSDATAATAPYTGGKVIINGRCQCPSNSDEVQGRCFKGPS